MIRAETIPAMDCDVRVPSRQRQPWMDVVTVYLLVTGAVGLARMSVGETCRDVGLAVPSSWLSLFSWYVDAVPVSWRSIGHGLTPISKLGPAVSIAGGLALCQTWLPVGRVAIRVVLILVVAEHAIAALLLYTVCVSNCMAWGVSAASVRDLMPALRQFGFALLAAQVLRLQAGATTQYAATVRLIASYILVRSLPSAVDAIAVAGMVWAGSATYVGYAITPFGRLIAFAMAATRDGPFALHVAALMCGVWLLRRPHVLRIAGFVMLWLSGLDLAQCVSAILHDPLPTTHPAATIVWILVRPVGMVALWVALIRFSQRARREMSTTPLCIQCGYDLTGNMSGVCPECGSDGTGGPGVKRAESLPAE